MFASVQDSGQGRKAGMITAAVILQSDWCFAEELCKSQLTALVSTARRNVSTASSMWKH